MSAFEPAHFILEKLSDAPCVRLWNHREDGLGECLSLLLLQSLFPSLPLTVENVRMLVQRCQGSMEFHLFFGHLDQACFNVQPSLQFAMWLLGL